MAHPFRSALTSLSSFSFSSLSFSSLSTTLSVLALALAACHSASPKAPAPRALPLFVDDGGPAGRTAVVFLHSAAGNSGHFAAQLAALRNQRRALAIDLPGHGRSPRLETPTIESVAAEVNATLEALELRHYVLVGHSWGGAVAVALAAQHPERVAGLLLLDPASDGRMIPSEVASALLESLRTNYEQVISGYWESMLGESKPAVRTRLLRELTELPREVVVGTLTSLLTFDPVTALGRYHGPRRTIVTALNQGPDAYQKLVPGLPSTTVEHTGHWLQLDRPDEVNRSLAEFLREVEAH